MTEVRSEPGELAGRFEAAATWEEFLESTEKLRDLWHAGARRAKVSDEVAERIRATGRRWNLLVLVEDWCGDAVNTLPHLAALVDAAPNLRMRLLGRDDNPDLMDSHLTSTSRSIPVVMILDEEFREMAWWGPRPAELQAWFYAEGVHIEPEERYRQMRMWYARDRGESTVAEVVRLIEEAADGAAITAAG